MKGLNMKSAVTTLSLVSILVLAGCGSSGSSSGNDTEPVKLSGTFIDDPVAGLD